MEVRLFLYAERPFENATNVHLQLRLRGLCSQSFFVHPVYLGSELLCGLGALEFQSNSGVSPLPLLFQNR